MSNQVDELAERLGSLARRNVPIGVLTTYRVGGDATLFAEPASREDVTRIAKALSTLTVPILVLGKGSNTLVADAGWPGLCIHVTEALGGLHIDRLEATAGAGMPYPVLARRLSAAGLEGMEWAVGIPGSVGGAVRMNAGGHGAETRDRLVTASVIDLKSGSERLFTNADLELSYRHSVLAAHHLVLEATFALDEGDAERSAKRLSEIVRWRRENQPGGQNAGSVFSNPPGDSAGRLIDEAGMKGFRVGSAAVSEKHANFIQADEGGSADDVRRVLAAVREKVKERLGVELAVELRLVGFGEHGEHGENAQFDDNGENGEAGETLKTGETGAGDT